LVVGFGVKFDLFYVIIEIIFKIHFMAMNDDEKLEKFFQFEEKFQKCTRVKSVGPF
jgi:hypothetical protein